MLIFIYRKNHIEYEYMYINSDLSQILYTAIGSILSNLTDFEHLIKLM